jgi:hypothetical protein
VIDDTQQVIERVLCSGVSFGCHRNSPLIDVYSNDIWGLMGTDVDFRDDAHKRSSGKENNNARRRAAPGDLL